MKNHISNLGLGLAMLILSNLAGCSDAAPIGQVVASVDNQDVTLAELRHEMSAEAGLSEAEALRRLIDRKILVAEAVSRGLERESKFHFDAMRMEDVLRVEALQRTLEANALAKEESEIWIAINASPWRYKDRLRLYLTKAQDDGSEKVAWVDTVDFATPPSEEILLAEVGDTLSLNGVVWTVRLREARVLSPADMFLQAKQEVKAQDVSRKIEQLLAQKRKMGQVIYQPGYGPAQVSGTPE